MMLDGMCKIVSWNTMALQACSIFLNKSKGVLGVSLIGLSRGDPLTTMLSM
jgi:hypothetical protein